MDILEILTKAAAEHAADIFIVSGAVLSYKAEGKLYRMGETPLSPDDTKALVVQIFRLAKFDVTEDSIPEREKDFSLSVARVGRFRANHLQAAEFLVGGAEVCPI